MKTETVNVHEHLLKKREVAEKLSHSERSVDVGRVCSRLALFV